MGGIILFIVLDLICLVCTIVFLRGKGSMLISGYNTSSKEEQDKYDKVKLCKSMGVCMGIVTAIMSILTILAYFVETGRMQEKTLGPVAYIATALIFIDVGVEMYYSNKKCKK
ncbi:MAG: DUF3784 domain-containing protein [bacterium]|nr:DUF3784 domain-containing protein [bacterium]